VAHQEGAGRHFVCIGRSPAEGLEDCLDDLPAFLFEAVERAGSGGDFVHNTLT
jgi:hypothetical protein